MRALIQDRYGGADVLELADVPVPAIRDGEVLVRVRAASLNAADVEYLRGETIVRIAGPRRPPHRIPGSDVAGVVVKVGPKVTGLSLGDEVFGDLFANGFGAFAQFVAAPASTLTIQPADLTFEQVATLPRAGALAWQSLHGERGVARGDRVLISGAGGGVGTFAVQLAAAAGAEVTGLDRAQGRPHPLPGRLALHRLRIPGLHADRRALRPDHRCPGAQVRPFRAARTPPGWSLCHRRRAVRSRPGDRRARSGRRTDQ